MVLLSRTDGLDALCPALIIVGAPCGIGTLRVMAGTTPVPLAVIAQDDLHPKRSLESQFRFVQPSRPALNLIGHSQVTVRTDLLHLF